MAPETIYWHRTGPLVKYSDGVLHVKTLNPQIKTKWRMSRWEMVKFAFRALRAGLTR